MVMTPASESKGFHTLKGSRYERVLFTEAESMFWEIGAFSRKGSSESERIWMFERNSIKRQDRRGRWISMVISWASSSNITLRFFILIQLFVIFNFI